MSNRAYPRSSQRGGHRGRGFGRGRGRGQGRGNSRQHPYAADTSNSVTPRRELAVTIPDMSGYESGLPDFADKTKLVEARKRELQSEEGLRLLQTSFTWQPTTPRIRDFVQQEELLAKLEELREEYRERCRSSIQEHCELHRRNNQAIIAEIRKDNNLPADERAQIMTEVTNMVDTKLSYLESLLLKVMANQEGKANQANNPGQANQVDNPGQTNQSNNPNEED
jgi:hypothetical protein